MKKRVLALILASVITLTNGNIAFAAEADNENTTDTMVMEEAVGESTQPKLKNRKRLQKIIRQKTKRKLLQILLQQKK